jgi:hypothetical protein
VPECIESRFDGALFTSGEALLLLPAPPSTSFLDFGKIRLFGMELRQ